MDAVTNGFRNQKGIEPQAQVCSATTDQDQLNRIIVSSMKEALFHINNDGIIVSNNPAAETLLKASVGSLIGKDLSSLIDDSNIDHTQAFFKWNDSYLLGIDAIDRDHKRLVRIINNLAWAVKCNLGMKVVKTTFARLHEYVGQHFTREEDMMAACGYAGLAEHKLQHKQIQDQLMVLNQNYVANPDSGVDQVVLDFLKVWLSNHIVVSDRDYASTMLSQPKTAEKASLMSMEGLASNIQKIYNQGQLFSILDEAPLMVLVVDNNGGIAYSNDMAVEGFGYTQKMFSGLSIDNLVPKDSESSHAGLRQQYATKPKVRTMSSARRLQARHKDGSVFSVQIGLYPFKARTAKANTSDQVLCVLRRSGVDPHWFSYNDTSFSTLFGFNKSMRLIYELIGESADTGLDVAMIRQDQSRVLARFSGTLLRDEHGVVTGAFCTVQNASERMHHASLIMESEASFRAIFDNIPDVYYETNHRGNITKISPSCLPVLGYTQEELINQPIHKLYNNAQDHRQHRNQLLKAKQKMVTLEGETTKKDGTKVTISTNASALLNHAGEIVGVLGIARDITDQKDIQFRLEKATAEAVQANKAKSDFIALISHEIRTPLTGMMGMADLILRTELNVKQAGWVQKIKKAGANQLTILNEVLDHSKLESGKFEIDAVDFDLLQLIQETVDIFSPMAELKGLKLHLHTTHDLPTIVHSDNMRIRQVLLNFLTNAGKYTELGSINVHVNHTEVENGWNVRVAVTDTGIGLSKDVCDKLFSPFVQGQRSTSRKHGGTGLGLSISKELVTLMRGETGVESEVGKGSTFWFTFFCGHSVEQSVS